MSSKTLSHREDGLRGPPPERQQSAVWEGDVICSVLLPAGPQVTDLDLQLPTHQAVPGGQVTVHDPQRLQVRHAGSDLGGYVEQGVQAGREV